MIIFLDTNIFYNDWFMKHANFKYLFNYINNDSHSLVLSNLVIQESENIRNRELNETLSELNQNIKKAQKMNFNILNFNLDSLGIEEYNLTSLINLKTDSLEKLDYNNIPHTTVVHRALKNKKPFMDGEKGYRDTLIWLSFLEYIVNNKITEDIAFITNNSTDFFKTKDKVLGFHPDLLDDIKSMEITTKIIPFTSLFAFINSNVDKDAHAIDYYASEDVFEDFILDEAVNHLENMSNSDLSLHFENSIFDTKVRNILDVRIDVLEDLEDLEVQYTSRLKNDDIFVAYKYNLRRVILEIDIFEIDYLLNKNELDKLFYEVEISSDIATMTCLIRPYFDVSFIYNEKDQFLKDYEVANLWLRF